MSFVIRWRTGRDYMNKKVMIMYLSCDILKWEQIFWEQAAVADPEICPRGCVINLGFRTFGLVIVINNKAYV